MALSFTDAVGDGTTTAFIFSFEGPDKGYIRNSDIQVEVDGVPVTFTLTGLNSVELDVAPADQSLVRIIRVMPNNTPYTDFKRGNAFGQRNVNNSFLQQLYLLHSLADGFREDDYYEKQNLNMGDNRIVNLADAVDPQDAITKGVYDVGVGSTAIDRGLAEQAAVDAQASADAAEISATNAATSETNASVSEGNASTSAASALAAKIAAESAAASVGLNVVLVNNAASPVTGVVGDLYICDTTGGDIVINFPEIVTEPAAIQVQKATGDANKVELSPFGTDTIDNSVSSFEITAAGTIAFQADLTGGTNNWQSISLNNRTAADASVDLYTAGVDFTAGVSTTLTMSQAFVKALIQITFDGEVQHQDLWEVSGDIVTFNSPIPGSVSSVQIRAFSTAEFGVPIDTSVTTAKLANSSVTQEKLFNTVTISELEPVGTPDNDYDVWYVVEELP